MALKLGALPVTGLEEGAQAKALRVDFQPELFDEAVEIKGYRIAWQRAAFCPCVGNNDQTQQVDPNCPLCAGGGWIYFRPSTFIVDADKVGELDALQTSIANAPDTVVIRGLLTNLSTHFEPNDKLGNWKFGDSQVTVRYQNKLGYFDRLTNLDSTIVYAEVLTVGRNNTANLKTRYPIVEANLIRSLTTEYNETDLDIVLGEIVWKPNKAPKPDTRIVVHYHCYPTWIVITHPHTVRSTWIKKKRANTQTPVGDFLNLPLQALVKYEFLP